MTDGLHLPKIPIDRAWNRFRWREILDIDIPSMPSARHIHVTDDLGDILDDSRLGPCFVLEVIGIGVSLVTHLGCQFWVLPSFFHHQLHLQKGTGHRFFYVHMFPKVQRHHGDREMGKIWHSNRYRIDLVTHLIEHLAEVLKTWNIR